MDSTGIDNSVESMPLLIHRFVHIHTIHPSSRQEEQEEESGGGRAGVVRRLQDQKERNTRTNLVLGTDAGMLLD